MTSFRPSATYMYFWALSREKRIHHGDPLPGRSALLLLIKMFFLKLPILSKTWMRLPSRSATYRRPSFARTKQCTIPRNAPPMPASLSALVALAAKLAEVVPVTIEDHDAAAAVAVRDVH